MRKAPGTPSALPPQPRPTEKQATSRGKQNWLLTALVTAGLLGSVYILYVLRHNAQHKPVEGKSSPFLLDESDASRETEKADYEVLESSIAATAPPPVKKVSTLPPSTPLSKNQKQQQQQQQQQKQQKQQRKATTAVLPTTSLYSSVEYSGLYRADGEHESYAGAWLAPKKRLLDSYRQLNRTTNLEGSTMAVSGYGRRQDPRVAIMSRDFFDFQVLHLSVTTNFVESIGRAGGPAKFGERLKSRVHEQMVQTVRELARPLSSMGAHGDVRLLNHTIALIPFTGFAASTDKSEFQAKIRKLYFQATFHSVFRFIRTIIVTVPTQDDFDVLVSMKLPIWKIFNFKARYDLKVNTEHPLSTVRLPKHSIMHVVAKMQSEPAYSRFRYVYYSEGDLVLHVRSEAQLLDALDRSGGNFAAAPHRMQSNPLPKAYEPDLQSLWSHGQPHKSHLESLKNVKLETEDAYMPRGSCCDDGRFDFKDCGNWWYYCPRWGLANFSTWIRFGEHGFTLPLGTEHRGRCAYSRQRRTCSLPPSCPERVPQSADARGVCGEVPHVDRVGY